MTFGLILGLILGMTFGGQQALSQTDTGPTDQQTATAPESKPTADTASVAPLSRVAQCEADLKAMPGSERAKGITDICAKALQLDGCSSFNSVPIYHFDKEGDPAAKSSQNILVLSLIHGDELQSGSVALSWLQRLQEIQPRNRWRVIPVLNPDGWKARTRTNANGVDVNRNFPSKDWDELAMKYWKTKAQGAERRFPGKEAGSEVETKCAIKHIEDFKPDFIISIHTPLGVLDFDGPKVAMPKFNPLPWVSLGNFPGSLGRYMWVDRNVPVLTVELRHQQLYAKHFEEFDKLQDITGTVAIQAERALKKKGVVTGANEVTHEATTSTATSIQ
ncbi:MAG: DUF2817 domain-containing protein [Bdellovibrionaceae bacterium]|nr:DUF2817 domain-containing protein [Pseudobdellovibrionaceae bacterium]